VPYIADKRSDNCSRLPFFVDIFAGLLLFVPDFPATGDIRYELSQKLNQNTRASAYFSRLKWSILGDFKK
jgi:hypothetical protein